jgi:hypothetical protein
MIWDVHPGSRSGFLPHPEKKPCCGSGMFIPDRILIFTHPGSRIPDPKTVTKERGEKKFVIILFF